MKHPDPLVIGIAGGSGSGKTTVAQQILNRVGTDQIAFIQHDSYYKDLSGLPPTQHATINFDHPNSLDTNLLIQHIISLRDGKPIEVPIYDFSTDSRTGRTFRVEPRRVVLVEGILIFTDAALRELFDIKIFVDTDSDIRFIRQTGARHHRARTNHRVGHQAISSYCASHASRICRAVQAICGHHHSRKAASTLPPWTWWWLASKHC